MLATEHLWTSTWECTTDTAPMPTFVATNCSILSTYCSTTYQMLFACQYSLDALKIPMVPRMKKATKRKQSRRQMERKDQFIVKFVRQLVWHTTLASYYVVFALHTPQLCSMPFFWLLASYKQMTTNKSGQTWRNKLASYSWDYRLCENRCAPHCMWSHAI